MPLPRAQRWAFVNESLHRLLHVPRTPMLLYRSLLRAALLPSAPPPPQYRIVYCSRTHISASRIVRGESRLLTLLRNRFGEGSIEVFNESRAADLRDAVHTFGMADAVCAPPPPLRPLSTCPETTARRRR